MRFVLGGSGHIAGIVNPPAAKKYCFWTQAGEVAPSSRDGLPASPDEWQASATRHEGSWWNDWQAWMEGRNAGERVPARVPGDGKLKVIEDAPGSYVSVRAGAG